ncbi:MAG: hypothetical protein QOE61_424 [Micromonosporaceae bacterium]|nr:hypothetical protein [Micromonosporaceae bacterium]
MLGPAGADVFPRGRRLPLFVGFLSCPAFRMAVMQSRTDARAASGPPRSICQLRDIPRVATWPIADMRTFQ